MRKGKTIYHCHGSQKGKKIKTYSSVQKAKKAHRAMAINRKK
jgi:hypothetical protein